ncbi:MAG: ATP-binding cassette domain-containing protein [Nitrospiraceae bacterium]|nr:MAG: ATP-binding cassette domain-containing protein [Nitrospiraceae bacterium]
MIELNNVTKTFGQTQALQSVTLTCSGGKTTVLIGPSGCGKSTLLRLIIGLTEQDSGTVTFDGVPVAPNNVFSLRRKMGYVIQEGGLFPHLTARRNITVMAGYLKWNADRIEERLDELLELTQFPHDGLDRFPLQLSGGQQQRVSLMRALMLDPSVLLLDEPLGALDPMIRADLQEELKEIFQALKKTVILVTHDIGEACYFGDEVVLLREGTIIQKGTPEDLVFAPVDPFVTHFINAQRSPLENVRAQ